MAVNKVITSLADSNMCAIILVVLLPVTIGYSLTIPLQSNHKRLGSLSPEHGTNLMESYSLMFPACGYQRGHGNSAYHC